MRNRVQIVLCAFSLLFLTWPAAAQVEFDGITMSMGGTIGMGYNGDLSGTGGGASTHGLSVNGSGSLNGSFYNPNFLSFSAQPYYNRSQANSESGSLFDSSGYTGNVNIFSGSHFPGNISFAQAFDSTGVFGVPNTTGLDTEGSSRSFGIGWGFLLPDLPSLSVGYGRGSGSSSVLGSDEQGTSDTSTFTLRSGYRLAGMSMGAGFTHITSESNNSGFLTNEQGFNSNTSSNTYTFNASRGFPTGGWGLGFSRSTYTNNYTGEANGSSNGATDNLYGTFGAKLWKIPLSGSIAYTDNVYGSFEEQLLSNGQPLFYTTQLPESHSLTASLSSSNRILPHIFVTAFVNRQELYQSGASVGLTQYGANVTGNLGERFKGLTATLGFLDSANKQGNEGVSAYANLNYRRNIGTWEFQGNYTYQQAVETLLAIYQTSGMSYGGSVNHRFFKRVKWSLGAGGGRGGFVQTSADKSHSESITTSLSGFRCSLSGFYSKSSGTAIVTPTGLVTVPLPIVASNTVEFGGQGKGAAVSLPLVRGLSLSASYSLATSQTTGLSAADLNSGGISNNKTETTTGNLTYLFRKLYFNAGVIQFRQDLTGSGTTPSVVTSYYFGISRWFKAF